MGTVKVVALIIFIILGLILVVKNYCPILLGILKTRTSNRWNDDRITQQLDILKTSLDPAKKATAFVSLMSLSYVLVHILINKGNSYDDEIQSEKFKKSLTPQMIERLYSLEGKYE